MKKITNLVNVTLLLAAIAVMGVSVFASPAEALSRGDDPCPGGNIVCFGPNGEYQAKGAAN